MGILNDVLQYKARKDADREAQSNAIPQALMAYQQAKQQSQDNMLKQLTVQATLAKAGFGIGQDGKLVQVGSNIDDLKAQDLQSKIQQRQTSQNLIKDFMSGSKSGGQLKSVSVGGITFENPDLAEQRQTQKNLGSARKNLDEYASNSMQVLDALDRLETQSEDLGDFKRGFQQQVLARGKMFIKDYGKDEKVTRYMGTLQRELIPLARKVAEEKGPITESDVARLETAFGSPTTPLEDKKFLLNEVKGKLKVALDLKKNVAKLSDDDFNKKYGEIYSKLSPKSKETAQSLPDGVTEDKLSYTMKKYNLSREEVLKRLKK